MERPNELAQLIRLEFEGFVSAKTPEEKTRRAGMLAHWAILYQKETSDEDIDGPSRPGDLDYASLNRDALTRRSLLRVVRSRSGED